MPKKLTLAQVARLAREHDPVAWDAMAPEARRAMVDRLNGAAAERAAHRKAMAAFDSKMRVLLNAGRRKTR